MKSIDLNKIPALILEGQISTKDAVNQISSFIHYNYPIFGLNRFDEDFREDVYLAFLEKGEGIMNRYDPKMADFFTFLYSNVISLINSRRKSLAISSLRKNVISEEEAFMLSEMQHKYTSYQSDIETVNQVPYSYKTKKLDYLRQVFANYTKEKDDKRILVLAMKACFYISDSQIKKVCHMYKIPEEDFYETIQFCKNSIEIKTERREKAEQRRNFAYYHHKKYETQLQKIENSEKNISSVLKNQLLYKQKKHYTNWENLNKKFQEGFLFLRPTNKTIGELLGICERQVTYYINSARQEFSKNKDKEDSKAK